MQKAFDHDYDLYALTHDQILILMARGWQPCLNLIDEMNDTSMRTTPYPIMMSDDWYLVLYC